MKHPNTFGLLAGLALTLAPLTGFAAPQTESNETAAPSDTAAAAAQSPRANAKQGEYEELTQGPVHEGFAEPVVFDAEAGIVVPKPPPEPIKEIQPAQKPEGANVTWIGGYWGWEAEKKDYLWVSGIWRVPPPDRQWKPGYWTNAEGGSQWVSGFWEPTQSDAKFVKTKLPKPPKSLEKGPSSPQPDDNHVWIPGYWDYSGSDYAWSGGYWTPGFADRLYVPSHYVAYPDGYVWVGGYWDYPVASRGFLFAPVYFRSPVYTSVGYSYTPGLVISTGFFLDNMFAYPRYGHYYFGNYYDSGYVGLGIYPTYNPLFLRIGYSDVWEHNWWDRQNRHDHDDWDRNKYKNFRDAYLHGRQDRFERLRENAAERPGRTFQEYTAKLASVKTGQPAEVAARPFKDVLADKKFVGEFGKQSKLSEASARQAILADRKGKPIQVLPKGGQVGVTPKPGDPLRTVIGETGKKTPDPVIDANRPYKPIPGPDKPEQPVRDKADKLDGKTPDSKPVTDSPDQPVKDNDKADKPDGKTPDSKPVVDSPDQPVKETGKSDTVKRSEPKESGRSPDVKTDRRENTAKEPQARENPRSTERKPVVRRIDNANNDMGNSRPDNKEQRQERGNDKAQPNNDNKGESDQRGRK